MIPAKLLEYRPLKPEKQRDNCSTGWGCLPVFSIARVNCRVESNSGLLWREHSFASPVCCWLMSRLEILIPARRTP